MLHLRGSENLPGRLYEQLIVNRVGVVVRPVGRSAPWCDVVSGSYVRALGLDDGEALLPPSRWGFQGYRLLAEYFACPERFLFVELGGLAGSVQRCQEDEELEIIVVFDRREGMLERVVDASNLALFCTPAVNLFIRKGFRIQIDQRDVEHHVVPDRRRPRDFEVYTVTEALGFDANEQRTRDFRPFYSLRDRHPSATDAAYFSLRREPRRPGIRDQRSGPRSHYVGSEVFMSLTDPWGAPYREDVRQLQLTALCTNRDLPFHMEIGRPPTDFTLESGLSVESVRCLVGPTPPRPSVAHGEAAWRLISQLSLNYLSLLDAADGQGASALRELLRLYGDAHDRGVQSQVEGIRSVTGRQVVDQVPQLPGEAPMTFARGIEITVVGDDAAFQGGGIVLFGTVLDEFFARYVTINSFTRMVLRTAERGEVMRWPARIGRRQSI
jgi:type VI secretion system protein ImpG